MFGLLPWWIKALVLAALIGAVTWGVHSYNESLRSQGRAETQAKWDAKDKADAEARATDAKQQIKFNDGAAGKHAESITFLNDQLGAAREKIARLSGRQCLSAGTVSVLNATGVLDGGAAAGEPASAPPAASSGSGLRFSTERDVAGYIALVRTRYAEIADQLNKILDIEDRRWPPEAERALTVKP